MTRAMQAWAFEGSWREKITCRSMKPFRVKQGIDPLRMVFSPACREVSTGSTGSSGRSLSLYSMENISNSPLRAASAA